MISGFGANVALPSRRASPISARVIQGTLRILAGHSLRLTGLERIGMRNALAIRRTERSFTFADLPREFDGYRLLHLTDLHLGMFPGLTERDLEDVVDAVRKVVAHHRR